MFAIQIPTPQPEGSWNWVGATIFFALFLIAALVYLHWTGQKDLRPPRQTRGPAADKRLPKAA